MSISWDCIINNGQATCTDPGTGGGQYTTYSQCLAVCTVNGLNDEKNKLIIYPNPVKNILTIEGEYKKIIIYDVFGKEVLNKKYQKQINMTNFSSGIYSLNIIDLKDNLVHRKIIIE